MKCLTQSETVEEIKQGGQSHIYLHQTDQFLFLVPSLWKKVVFALVYPQYFFHPLHRP